VLKIAIEIFHSPPGGWLTPSPIILGKVIEDMRTILAPPKRFRIQRIVSPLGALKICGNCTLEVKP